MAQFKKISDHVTWVGKVDWELQLFHGHEYSTKRGSSYNSYLIQDRDKTVLVDTVWAPYDKEFVSRLKEVTDLKKIDAIVMCHNEVDHSGALTELLREIPGTPIYCTKKGEAILRGHYHQDWNYQTVKTGDTLPLGETTITFVEATMLHWPDTMMCWLSGDDVLLSNDVFGQHYATESLYDDCADVHEVMQEAKKYYANIVSMYSPMAKRKLAEVEGMQLPIKMIAPSHGVIWRHNVQGILEGYKQWSAGGYKENQITLVYDTMWQSTRVMAERIAQGIEEADPTVTVKLMNAAIDDKNDILTELFASKAFLVGSPTVNNGYTYAMAGIMEMMRGLKLKGKKGAAFGSYGWGGEAVKMLTKLLTEAGIEVVLPEGLRVQWVPDDAAQQQCVQFGRDFVAAL